MILVPHFGLTFRYGLAARGWRNIESAALDESLAA